MYGGDDITKKDKQNFPHGVFVILVFKNITDHARCFPL
jgi:hypothetical protein